jgi:hypothetical protein
VELTLTSNIRQGQKHLPVYSILANNYIAYLTS